MEGKKLGKEFYGREILEVSKDLIGKVICRKINGKVYRYKITETEAYCGVEDKACHASKGRTQRTEAFYMSGGHVYIFICYGIHTMLNIVTGKAGDPQAALIRGVEGASGPGKVGKLLQLSKKQYGIDLTESDEMWLEDNGTKWNFIETPRIGIDYAGEPWVSKPWRFYHKPE